MRTAAIVAQPPARRFQLVISRPIIHEVLGVLARKFARDREQLVRTALFLVELGEVVHPRRRLQCCGTSPTTGISNARPRGVRAAS
ncbi:MAG: hypothetical protein M0015_03535 [Betaproteobacteria bacterium]|nr:hypothetical protein [Betaproteobacteria bacterium]